MTPPSSRSNSIGPVLAALALAILVLMNGWVQEDAFITFRTIDNFVAGYGLRYNIEERVQTYTHPLWMGLLTMFYLVSREFILTAILAGTVLSFFVAFLVFKQARNTPALLLALVLLSFSRAFIHFSTSGLENGLSHLILALYVLAFMVVYRNPERGPPLLATLTGLAALTRLDLALFFIPGIAWVLWKDPSIKTCLRVALYSSPLLLWLGFSLFYYGVPFPNTYYAKLGNGIPGSELHSSGIFYLYHSLVRDPVTLGAFALAMLMVPASRSWHFVPPLSGALLYLVYVVTIGGDYMCGRFLSTITLVSVTILVSLRWSPAGAAATALAALVGSITASSPPIAIAYAFPYYKPGIIPQFDQRVEDSHRLHYQWTGVFVLLRDYKSLGTRLSRAEGEHSVSFRYALNRSTIHTPYREWITDDLGILDPLLARLPARPNWRPGHFQRTIPLGYQDHLRSGEPLCDENIDEFNRRIRFITRGPLFSRARLRAIAALNLGAFDSLVDRTWYRNPPPGKVTLEEAASGMLSRCQSLMNHAGLEVSLPQALQTEDIAIELDGGANYQIQFLSGDRITAMRVAAHKESTPTSGPFALYTVRVPPEALSNSVTALKIVPPGDSVGSHDGRYALRKLTLVDSGKREHR